MQIRRNHRIQSQTTHRHEQQYHHNTKKRRNLAPPSPRYVIHTSPQSENFKWGSKLDALWFLYGTLLKMVSRM